MTPANPLVLAIAAVSFLTGPFAIQAKAGHWELVEHRSTERRIREQALYSYILGFQMGSYLYLDGYALSGGVLFSSSTVPPSLLPKEEENFYLWVREHTEDPEEGSIGVGGEMRTIGQIRLRGTGDAVVHTELEFHCKMYGASSNPDANNLHEHLVVHEDPVPPAVAQWWGVLLGTLQWYPIDEERPIGPREMTGALFRVRKATKLHCMVGTSGGISLAEIKVDGAIRDQLTF